VKSATKGEADPYLAKLRFSLARAVGREARSPASWPMAQAACEKCWTQVARARPDVKEIGDWLAQGASVTGARRTHLPWPASGGDARLRGRHQGFWVGTPYSPSPAPWRRVACGGWVKHENISPRHQRFARVGSRCAKSSKP